MRKLLEILRTEYRIEYKNMALEKQYVLPKIFHGGKSFDLSKRWYVYYSYRNPFTGEITRQPAIYMNVNSDCKTVKERMNRLKIIQKKLTELLKSGFSPYLDPETNKKYTAKSSLIWALEKKVVQLSQSSISDYESRTKLFIKHLEINFLAGTPIDEIKRSDVLNYLNEVSKNTSARTRNNHRQILSSLFSILKENELVPENIVESIGIEKTKSVRHKSYSPKQVEQLLQHIEKKDPELFLFVRIVAYNFLRPVEVVRLRFKDLKLDENPPYLEVKAKNKLEKIKIIPSILFPDLNKLSFESENDFIFKTNAKNIETTEVNRRNYFGKKFLEVKKELGLGPEYTMYSFRHTFITKMYRELRKESNVLETYDRLMTITGHSTLTALKSYLREIDAELATDYSEFLK